MNLVKIKKIKKEIKIKKTLNFLGMKTIIKDIKEIPLFYKWLFLAIGIVTVFLSFFDINHFIDPENNKSMWSIINELNAPKPKYLGNIPSGVNAALYSLSGITSFTGIVCVFLITFGKTSTFFWGAINNIVSTLFTFDVGYIGDAQLSLFIYLPFQFIGWYMWEKSKIDGSNSTVAVRNTNSYYVLPLIILSALVLSFGWYYEVTKIYPLITGGPYSFSTQQVPHLLDSIENSMGIIAVISQVLRLKEQWVLWIISDIIMIIMYSGGSSIGSGKGININLNLIIQTTLYTVNGIIAWMVWYGKFDNKTGWIKKNNSQLKIL